MSDEQIVAPEPAATEEPVAEKQEEKAPEAADNTEGQEQNPPAEQSEERSESQKRRDRRKANERRMREEAEAARAELARSQQRFEQAKEQAAKSETPPQESDYGDYNEYLVAMGAFHAARAFDGRFVEQAESETKAHQEQLEAIERQQQQEAAQAWADQVAEAKTRYSDFEQVAYTAPISDEVAQIAMASDMGADLAYYLGTNRAEAAALSQMSPIEAARNLGRIEAELSLPKPNTQPSAPDPISPVKPRPTGVKSPDKMTMEEYRAARMAGKI